MQPKTQNNKMWWICGRISHIQDVHCAFVGWILFTINGNVRWGGKWWTIMISQSHFQRKKNTEYSATAKNAHPHMDAIMAMHFVVCIVYVQLLLLSFLVCIPYIRLTKWKIRKKVKQWNRTQSVHNNGRQPKIRNWDFPGKSAWFNLIESNVILLFTYHFHNTQAYKCEPKPIGFSLFRSWPYYESLLFPPIDPSCHALPATSIYT